MQKWMYTITADPEKYPSLLSLKESEYWDK